MKLAKDIDPLMKVKSLLLIHGVCMWLIVIGRSLNA